MPLRGKGVSIAPKLQEVQERRDRMEMMNYQQKMVGQQQSIKMLMEEERFVSQANQAAKMHAEIAKFQQETRAKHSKTTERGAQHDPYSPVEHRSHTTSIIMDQKRTEPLITKAYNAFRRKNSKPEGGDVDNLIPTEEYLDEQQKQTFRDTTLSGLRHAQRLVDAAGAEGEQGEFPGLPSIVEPKLSLGGPDPAAAVGDPVSEQELISHI